MPLAGAREAGLDAVVAGERREALGQGAARELHPPHRRCEVVVDRAPGHPAEVGEGPHVTVEEGELVLALVEPDEVPPRVHQPHQELTTKWLRRGTHHGVADLIRAVEAWVADWNEHPRPFSWHKTADQIFDNLTGYLNRIPNSGH